MSNIKTLKMKRFIGILALTIIFFIGQNASAQNFKFGHINSDELFGFMPEIDTVNSELQKQSEDLQNTLEILQVEFNNKYNDYVQELDNLTDLIRTTKEEDLASLQTRISTFQAGAEQELQTKQMELMAPVLQKAEKAIKDVAKENGFTYIFDLSRGPVIYWDENLSEDIMPLVKARLGIVE
jgi:outer membrane protein